jgi:PBP1b-binding outer membrane lipoprotein LpoB
MYDLKQKLYKCSNVAEMLDTIKNDYNLENIKPGPIAKAVLVNKLCEAVTQLNAQRKENNTALK